MKEYYVIEPNMHINWARDGLYIIAIDEEWNLVLSKTKCTFNKDSVNNLSYGDFIKPYKGERVVGSFSNELIVGKVDPEMLKLVQAVYDSNVKDGWLSNMLYNRGVQDPKKRYLVDKDGYVIVQPGLMFEIYHTKNQDDWRVHRKNLKLVEQARLQSLKDEEEFNEKLRQQKDVCYYRIYQLVEHEDGWGLQDRTIQEGCISRKLFDEILDACPKGREVKLTQRYWNDLLKRLKKGDITSESQFGTTGSVEIEYIEKVTNWIYENEVKVKR